MDLGQFAARMQQKAKDLEPAVAAVVKEVAISVVTEVARDTPIKSGQAQSNWIASIGLPFPFYKANATANRGWQESVDFAKQVLAPYRTGADVHIVNNVPYIAKLNSGSSSQAPALFVQAAVLRAQYKIKGIRIKL